MEYPLAYKSRLIPIRSLLVLSTVLILRVGTVDAASPFELVAHSADHYGANDVFIGDIEIGIRRLNHTSGSYRQAHTARAPILIYLCVGYTMLKDVRAAWQACDAAVENGVDAGSAYNNRGVLNIVKGDYDAATSDFEAAISEGGTNRIARRNLVRTRALIAQEQRMPNYLARNNHRR